MSRVGNLPISLPKGVDIQLSKSNLVTVKGPKGTLQEQIDPDITVSMSDGTMTFARPTEQNRHKSLHGLSWSSVSDALTLDAVSFTVEIS